MFNPCVDHCFLRYGRQYTKDCDDKCAYAKAVKENRELYSEQDEYCAISKPSVANVMIRIEKDELKYLNFDEFPKDGKELIDAIHEAIKLAYLRV